MFCQSYHFFDANHKHAVGYGRLKGGCTGDKNAKPVCRWECLHTNEVFLIIIFNNSVVCVATLN